MGMLQHGVTYMVHYQIRCNISGVFVMWFMYKNIYSVSVMLQCDAPFSWHLRVHIVTLGVGCQIFEHAKHLFLQAVRIHTCTYRLTKGRLKHTSL